MPIDESDPSYVGALARGLSVIRTFDDGREKLTLTDVAQATGLPRATVRRSLLTLEALGYVATDGKHFRLTPRILALGYAYLAATPLPRLLQPTLEQISRTLQESCSASTLDGGDIVYVARAETRRIMAVGLSVGSRLPAYCTSMGRVLLASLPREQAMQVIRQSARVKRTPETETDPQRLVAILDRVRQDGYCMVDQELEIGLRSLAVPIHNTSGTAIAAMNIGVQAGRVPAEELVDRFLPVLRDAAEAVRPGLIG